MAARKAYCGLEAIVTTPDGTELTLYVADGFDDAYASSNPLDAHKMNSRSTCAKTVGSRRLLRSTSCTTRSVSRNPANLDALLSTLKLIVFCDLKTVHQVVRKGYLEQERCHHGHDVALHRKPKREVRSPAAPSPSKLCSLAICFVLTRLSCSGTLSIRPATKRSQKPTASGPPSHPLQTPLLFVLFPSALAAPFFRRSFTFPSQTLFLDSDRSCRTG